jgi:hypothetical protein
MKTFWHCLFAGAVLCSPSLSEAQVETGERVRVTTKSDDRRWTGRVKETTADGFVIELENAEGDSLAVALADVKTLETRGPRTKGQGAWSKAKWGALIGGISGLSLAFQHEQVGEEGVSPGHAAALGAWSGGLFGGLIGALVGATNPGEGWVDVRPQVQFGGRNPGFGLAVTIDF